MDIFLFQEREVENKSLLSLLSNGHSANKEIAKKERLKTIAILGHISSEIANFSLPYVKEIGKFLDGRSLYEIRIQVSDNLIRILCSCDKNKVILYSYLVKPSLYEKRIKDKVDKEYLEKIEKAQSLALLLSQEKGFLINIDINN